METKLKLEYIADDGYVKLIDTESKKVIATTIKYGKCLFLTELFENNEFNLKVSEIEGILFKAEMVYFWDTDKMKIIREIKMQARCLTNVKQANNWADKVIARLHYEFPY